ncbi:MAG TPA: hypothetical protein VES95_05815 [Dermatophilaceae bacterium]|nr:hypothetical protein [Dermatophilaceae bacterium]
MGSQRPQGRTSSTSAGSDPPAGAQRGAGGPAAPLAAEEPARSGGLRSRATTEPPDELELDERERRKSPHRKPAGPDRERVAGAEPVAPPPDSPPPTDPR